MNKFTYLGDYLSVLQGNQSTRKFARICGISHTYLTNLKQGIDPRTGKANQISVNALVTIGINVGIDPSQLAMLAVMDLTDESIFKKGEK